MTPEELGIAMFNSLVVAKGGGVVARIENQISTGLVLVTCNAGCHVRYVGTIADLSDVSIFVNAVVYLNEADHKAMVAGAEKVCGPIEEGGLCPSCDLETTKH